MNDINPAQIQRYLGGVDFPTTKDGIVESARQNGAPDEILSALDNLPEDESFSNPADVSMALL